MKREVKIGIFAVAMLLCAWGGIRFLSGIDLLSRNCVYYAVYDRINGVQAASPIIVNGVKVGTVTGISFDPARSRKVVLELTVRRRYAIPSDSQAAIRSDGLLGGKAIDITLGSSPEPLRNRDTIRSEYGADLMDIAGSELEFVKQKITQVVTDMSTTLNNLNRLLEENNESISGTVRNLNSISGNLDAVLSDKRESLSAMIDGLSEFSETLGQNSQKIDSMITGLSRFSTALADSNLGENLAGTAEQLNELLGKINDGDGSVGMLLNDHRLYTSLSEASGNLSKLLADLKEHPSRYVHFSLFGRSERKEAERMRRDSIKAAEKAARDAAKQK